ncbi:H(+)/Cl(-) exchange transporter-like protein [Emericellopsis cladophorae]|uniref:H(+)/Cl(-) exchange transporter-like protein n=1 Tax=Emericellopsis cladophorae TaxID=2686198 RepID=A0A9P9XVY9_9HYPO|nr:H(+)/Cl(-) exchange transporter-like protein [Emericellopsis cladophorae]KAI6778824.1 H(+)/Cl(-) exchange transporter-like protein [Emericellopsis cladophorae]
MSGLSRENSFSQPTSPLSSRRPNLERHVSLGADERTALLGRSRSRIRLRSDLRSETSSPKRAGDIARHGVYTGGPHGPRSRHHSRHPSWGSRIIHALSDRQQSISGPFKESSSFADDRVWYDQFTSTDWVHDTIADSYRVKALRSRKDFWGRVLIMLDGVQGWILSALSGFIIALVAYTVSVAETVVFDWKDGYCATAWYLNEQNCCPDGPCEQWRDWAEVIKSHPFGKVGTEYVIYLPMVVGLSCVSCWMALFTKTVVPSAYRMSTFDENLGASGVPILAEDIQTDDDETPRQAAVEPEPPAPMVYYPAAGSGVAEVRVILSGFVLHGFLGLKTLLIKMSALILSVSSGLSIGKEGPYVHIATCVGNILCRLFSKYDRNDAKRREVLSAAAAAGVTVAFGAPLGGVLFSLEEVSYFFPAKTLFRTFFCCIVAALSLKFLNPYGTHKIVMFEVRYYVDWEYFELVSFIFTGFIGGAVGALFIKASKLWAESFRRVRVIKKWPLLEVFIVSLATALLSYWNVLTKLPVAKLLLNLASPCDDPNISKEELGLCPSSVEDIPDILVTLLVAFLIKGFLTTITFGIKVPSGIYVPSMVTGGLLGRMIGHLVQWAVLKTPDWLSVTLAVILFEITGSLDYVLPFSLSILVAKWTADAIEPNSIYDLLTAMNSYPFLDNKHKPVFTGELSDILPRVRRERIIDISNSPVIRASKLRSKLELLHRAGELDGGLPLLRNGVLVGLIPAPDLQFALDQLDDEESTLCVMDRIPHANQEEEILDDPSDFTKYIDPAPVSLDIKSPMDLVYECFSKLGLRYICVLREGKYAGMTHKKTFVKYMREQHEEEYSI